MLLAESLAPRLAKGLTYRDPSDIDGLTCWLDANNVDLDASGNVSRMIDRSGRGNHATQAVAGTRPPRAIVASRPAVQTDTGKTLTIAATTDTNLPTTGGSIYCVFDSTTAAASAVPFAKWSGSGVLQQWNFEASNTGGAAYVIVRETGTLATRTAGTPDATTGTVRAMSLHYTPGLGVMAALGSTESAYTACAGPNITTTTTCIGAYIEGVGSGPINQRALFIFSRALTAAERTFMLDYCARQYGAS